MGDSNEQLVFIHQFAAKRQFLARPPAADGSDAEMDRLEFNFEYFPRDAQDAAGYPLLWWKKLIGRDGGYLLFYSPGVVHAECDAALFYPVLAGYMPRPADTRIAYAPRGGAAQAAVAASQ